MTGVVPLKKPQQEQFMGEWPISQYAYALKKSGKLWTPEALDRRQHVNVLASGVVEHFSSYEEPGGAELGLKYHIKVLDAVLEPTCKKCGSPTSL